MPETSAGLTRAFFSTALVARHVACHQSSGFCSDHPGFGDAIGCSAIAVASTFPSSSQMSVLVPLVPMSMPRRVDMTGSIRMQKPGARTQEPEESGRDLIVCLLLSWLL